MKNEIRWLKVLRLRAAGLSYEDIGRVFGLTKQRVQAIEASGIRFVRAIDAAEKKEGKE